MGLWRPQHCDTCAGAVCSRFGCSCCPFQYSRLQSCCCPCTKGASLTSLRERSWIESSMPRTRWLCSSLSLWLPAGWLAKSLTIRRSSLQQKEQRGQDACSRASERGGGAAAAAVAAAAPACCRPPPRGAMAPAADAAPHAAPPHSNHAHRSTSSCAWRVSSSSVLAILPRASAPLPRCCQPAAGCAAHRPPAEHPSLRCLPLACV